MKIMKILANDGISDDAKKILEENGFTVITDKVNQENLIEKINSENYEGILVRSATQIRKDIIDSCPNIKFIGRGGVGMDNIDVNYAREKGIMVFNTPASSSQSVAELVIGQMFSLSRFIGNSSKNMENGDFNKLKKEYANGVELRGKTLGIVGFGRIGQSLASYAIGIGMNVVAIDIEEKTIVVPLEFPITYFSQLDNEIKTNTHSIGIPVIVKTDLDDILPICDYISIHVPKQENGNSVINSREFSLMKKGVRIINAARGGVVNEQDLLKAIEDGIVSGCALDVFENEPNPNKELLSNSKILTTPHIGAATGEAQDRIGIEIANTIIENFTTVEK